MTNIKRVVRKYVKNVASTGYDAFFMGVTDGRAGEMQEFPPPPDGEKERLVALWALELYKDGFKHGRREAEDEST